jgi:hypothetical protein
VRYGVPVQSKTMEWAQGLRIAFQAEIDAMLARGVTRSEELERIVRLRQQMKQVESLIAVITEMAADPPMPED